MVPQVDNLRQIFGEEEKIYGYEDLVIKVCRPSLR